MKKINRGFSFLCLGFCLCLTGLSSIFIGNDNAIQVKADSSTPIYSFGDYNSSIEEDEKTVLSYEYSVADGVSTATLTLNNFKFTFIPSVKGNNFIMYFEKTLDNLNIILKGDNKINVITSNAEDYTVEVFNYSAKNVVIKSETGDTSNKKLDVNFILNYTSTPTLPRAFVAFDNRYDSSYAKLSISDNTSVYIDFNANINGSYLIFAGFVFYKNTTITFNKASIYFCYKGTNELDASSVYGFYAASGGLEFLISSTTMQIDYQSVSSLVTYKGIYSSSELYVYANEKACIMMGITSGVASPTVVPVLLESAKEFYYYCNPSSLTYFYNSLTNPSAMNAFKAGNSVDNADILLRLDGGALIANCYGESGLVNSSNEYNVQGTEASCAGYYYSSTSIAGDDGTYVNYNAYTLSQTKILSLLAVPVELETYCTNFLETNTSSCASDGNTNVTNLIAGWGDAKTAYDSLTTYGKAEIFMYVKASATNSLVAKANARYDYIYTKYHSAYPSGINDFMARSFLMGNVTAGNYIRNYDSTTLISIISISSIFLLISGAWFMYHRKRKISIR